MCLQAEGIDENNGGVRRLRRAKGLRYNNGGVGRGQGIHDASEESETTADVAGDRRRTQGIYENNGGIGGGRLPQRLQQRKRMRRRRIEDASKVPKTTTEATSDRRRAWWIGNGNVVLILLAFRLLTVTLSSLCIVAVSF